MKTAITLLLVAVAATGCASMGPFQASPTSDQPGQMISAFPPPPTVDPFSAPAAGSGPTLMIPAGGGSPVMGIPMGGNLFLPVTGGAPVIGISIGP